MLFFVPKLFCIRIYNCIIEEKQLFINDIVHKNAIFIKLLFISLIVFKSFRLID